MKSRMNAIFRLNFAAINSKNKWVLYTRIFPGSRWPKLDLRFIHYGVLNINNYAIFFYFSVNFAFFHHILRHTN